MKPRLLPLFSGALALLSITCFAAKHKADKPAGAGWLNWRGPDQNGTSRETGLPDHVDAKAPLWSADFPGQSTAVISNGKLYINGFLGEGPTLQEVITCFDAETGKKIWSHEFNDFLSDTIYLRYATSSPTIDPETGNVYMQGTQGIFACFTADGQELWEHSMMEEFGRMTFPNSRTASPVVDKELVITRGITANWGASGAPGDRFYAFDKKTGELVWSSSPANQPQDNTFSNPLLTWLDGKRVLISAAGDSSVVGLNARNGDPIFHFPAAAAGAKGGINASVLRYKDALLVIHESENLDTSEVGRSAAYKLPTGSKPPEPGKPQPYLAKDLELWRNPIGNLGSSPCLAGNRMYEVTGVGEVASVDADTGKILWKKKLAPEQRQSAPFFADGKLYVAMYIAGGEAAAGGGENSGNGELYVIKPGDADMEILSHTLLTGRCFGSPIAYNGRLYLQTDKRLYCFGKKGDNKGLPPPAPAEEWPKAGEAAKLQVIPNEVFLRPGEALALRFRSLDANGFTVDENVDPKQVKIETFIPPTALVKAKMNGSYVDGKMVADAQNVPSAGAYMATFGNLKGTMRGRILSDLPIFQDFEKFELTVKTGPGIGNVAPPPAPGAPPVPPGPTNWNTVEPPTDFAYPPLAWNAARFRFEVRKAPGDDNNKALCKTIDNKRMQRGQVFIGHPEAKNYTAEADVMTEGNKRKMSEIGLINQRYLIVMKGNGQQIDVSSNQALLHVSVPFKWSPNVWYHLKTRVDVAADGSGVIKAKAWKKGDPEPEAWSIEVPHLHANQHGCPGFYSLTPQEQRAWIDNISVIPNEAPKSAAK